MSRKRNKPPSSLVTPLSRRSLLRGIGLGAIALALPPLRTLDAQSAPRVAKRFVNFFVGNGMVPRHYYPEGPVAGAQPIDESWFPDRPGSAGYVLSPLVQRTLADGSPAYTKATVIEGINFGCAEGYDSPSHGRGGISMLSGGRYAREAWTHPSIDQIIAAHHPQSAGAPYPAIFLNADTTRKNSKERKSYSWREGGNPVTEVSDPRRALSTFFDAGAFGTTPAPPSGPDPMALRVLEANRAQLDRLRARLGAPERDYLDAHLSSLEAIERRLNADPAPTVGECLEPSLNGSSSFPDRVDDMLAVMQAALACGRSNVITLCLQGSGSDVRYNFLPDMDSGREHHSISHDNDEAGWRLHSTINRWAVDQVTKFATRLSQIPEGDGTMLDNSLITLSYELGKGRGHEHSNVPQIIFGGAGGFYGTGRYVKLAGREVNDLLLTHVRACGIDESAVPAVGVRDFNGGLIDDLIA